MEYRSRRISESLYKLWSQNVRIIMAITKSTWTDLAKISGVSRQAIYNMLNRKDSCLSVIQFLGFMWCVREMIENSVSEKELKNLAIKYWTEIISFYKAESPAR